jgi:putative transposase
MRWKWHSAEDIVAKLASVREQMSAGKSQREALEATGVSVATYHRWKLRYGSLAPDQVSQLRELVIENARLRRALAELDAPLRA